MPASKTDCPVCSGNGCDACDGSGEVDKGSDTDLAYDGDDNDSKEEKDDD